MKDFTTADRLKQIMNERGLKQVDILRLAKPHCARHGISLGKSSLNQYISGYAEPGQHKLFILGLALNVSEAWLMGYDVPMERADTGDVEGNGFALRPVSMKRFPMLGEIACGEPIFANEDHESYIDASADIKADFCLTAKGDSMIGARIHDGDVVFIKKQPIVENGEIAAVVIDNEATLKRWYFYPDEKKLVLAAENSAFAPFVYIGAELDEITCLGKAVCFMSNL